MLDGLGGIGLRNSILDRRVGEIFAFRKLCRGYLSFDEISRSRTIFRLCNVAVVGGLHESLLHLLFLL